MRFVNRQEAGEKLASALEEYAGRDDVIIVGLPRGGVIVAAEIARALALSLDIIVPRKIGHEHNPEYAIGAVAETGEAMWNEAEQAAANPHYLRRTIETEQREAQRRLETYRAGLPPRHFHGKTVILVDDGVATGYTMQAAIQAARTLGAATIIVAVPHGAKDSLGFIRTIADEVVALDEIELYLAVGAQYDDFPQTSDDEVIAALQATRTAEKEVARG